MLLPVPVDSVGRGECLKKMAIKVGDRPGGVSATAFEGGCLVVDQAASSSAVLWSEYVQKVIGEVLVGQLGEAA